MPAIYSFTIFIIAIIFGNVNGEGNFSCYQCTKQTYEPCPEETLLPCPANRDRCVTHISKDATNGFVLKRECGLGPCGFADDMVNRGLGLDHCDTSKDEYFCVFCCKDSGCNRDILTSSPHPLMIFTVLSIAHLIKR